MTLMQNAVSDPVVFTGPGRIEQDENRRLVFTLYCQESNYTLHDLICDVHECQEPGKLIPDEDYYSLRACDETGAKWRATDIVPPSIAQVVHGCPWIVRGRMHCMTRLPRQQCHERESPVALTLWIPYDYDLPACTYMVDTKTIGNRLGNKTVSLAATQFQSCGLDFTIFKSDSGLVVDVGCTDSQGLPPHLDVRVREALQFVLGLPMPLIAGLLHYPNASRLTAYGLQQSAQCGSPMPPLDVGSMDAERKVWSLFEKYLEYIVNETDTSGDYRALSVYVLRTLHARSASIEAEALTLGVCVEGLLKIGYYGEKYVDHEFASLVNDFYKELESSGRLPQSRRVQNSLEAWRRNAARMKPGAVLDVLSRQGVVDKDHVRKWKSLRHASAHGDSLADGCLQTLIDECDAVRVLFNQLVFGIINYTGPYTDYATYGWPMREYRCGLG